ncbi:MAG: acyltransferase [Methylacidiphilales bacterium]|nr:acyltransferase [Candidatus Methylacidiphilales bacterium]
MELLIRCLTGLRSRYNQWILHSRGVAIEGKCWFQDVAVPRNPWDIQIGAGVMLDEKVTLLSTGEKREAPRIILHSGTYINRYTMLDATEKIELGEKCLIGPFCYITDHDHDLEKGAGHFVSRPVIIRDGCWIGAHVTVLKGVEIGENSIVGAGSVVTRSLPPGCVAAGNPARVIKQRTFSSEDLK